MLKETDSIDELVCPKCRSGIAIRRLTDGSVSSLREIRCPGCRVVYPIIEGVPHFAKQLGEQAANANSFGFAWKGFWRGLFGKDSVFGLKIADTTEYFLKSLGIEAQDLKGATILDAGTGSGRVPMGLRAHDCLVYAVDIHNGLGLVNKAIATSSVRVYQADLMNLPFRDNFFDYVWSSGVIHITPDTEKAFNALTRKVKPGGRLFVSVYGTTLHHYRLFRRLLPFSRHLPPVLNYLLSSVIAVPLYVIFNVGLFCVRLMRGKQSPPYAVLGFSIENIEYKSYPSIVLNLFDQLHPRYQREHSVGEIQRLFESSGFTRIEATNVVGMVEMRGVKERTATPA